MTVYYNLTCDCIDEFISGLDTGLRARHERCQAAFRSSGRINHFKMIKNLVAPERIADRILHNKIDISLMPRLR